MGDEALRRQGMADAVVALVITRRFPNVDAEDLGALLGLRQRDILDSLARMKAGDQVVRVAVAGQETRSVEVIEAELRSLRAELRAAKETAAREAAAARRAARDAARAAARAAKQPVVPASSYRNAGTCEHCGKAGIRNMGSHMRSHRLWKCPTCGREMSDMARGLHLTRCGVTDAS